MLPRSAATARSVTMMMNASTITMPGSAAAATGPLVDTEPPPPPAPPLPIDVLALEPFAAPKDSMQMFLDELRLSINATAQDGDDLNQLVDLVRFLRLYYRPVLIITGCAGNLLTWLTLTSARLNKFSCSPYLALMALTDSIFLLVLLLTWLNYFDIEMYNSAGWCQALTYVSYVSTFLPVWILVALNVDRTLYVTHVTRHHEWCSALRSKIVVASLFILAVVVYLNLSLLSGVVMTMNGDPICVPLPKFSTQMQVLDKLDVVINVVIPHATLLTLTVLICVYYCWLHRKSQCADPNPSDRKYGLAWSPPERHFIRMTFLVTALFLLLNMPNNLMRIWVMFSSLPGTKNPIGMRLILWQQVLLHLYFTRFAVNFIVCFASSSIFRRSVRVACVNVWEKLIYCRVRHHSETTGRLAKVTTSTASSILITNTAANANILETTSV